VAASAAGADRRHGNPARPEDQGLNLRRSGLRTWLTLALESLVEARRVLEFFNGGIAESL
jgi:hypothetical protein